MFDLGREALIRLNERVYTRLCRAVIDDPGKRAQNIAVWAALAKFNRELRAPMLNLRDLAERTVKSRLVEDLAVAYVDAYTQAGFRGMCTLYMHHSMCHIPRMILRLDVDISVVFQQGLEHLLKAGKVDAIVFSNKRLRRDSQDVGRNKQVLGKERERKKMRVEVSMQKSRTEQRMEADQERVAKETVDRAQARGLLQSRIDRMIAMRVTKQDGTLQLLMVAHEANRGALDKGSDLDEELTTQGGCAPLPPVTAASTSASGSRAPGADLDLPTRNALNVPSNTGNAPSAAGAVGLGAAGAKELGAEGHGFAAGAATGENNSARGGRGRGARGRGAGRARVGSNGAGRGTARSTVEGRRRISASARMQR
jgi:hypothetical protein